MIVCEGVETSRPFRLGSGWPGPAPSPGLFSFLAPRARSVSWRGPHQPGIVREQPGLGPGGAAEPDEHARHIALDRRLRQVQPARYLGIRQSLAQAAEYLGLPLGQRGDELAGVLTG